MARDVKELMARVGKIRILTNKLVDDRLSGDYHSTFKGQGVEFDEVRPYLAGDDVRTIDWNVTAKTGVPHIKRFSEERELTILFMVDVSGSQSYGSVRRSKAELAAEVTAVLALTAIRNQDKIGLVLFSDRIVKYIPPRKGRDSVMRLVREVLAAEDDAVGGTDISEALQKALDDAGAAGGGIVYVPAGRYLLAKPVTISGDNVQLLGCNTGTHTQNGALNTASILLVTHGRGGDENRGRRARVRV